MPALPAISPSGRDAHLAVRLPEQDVTIDDGRLSVRSAGRTVLDLPIAEIRRVQFDVERGRPATFVIVPERAMHEPQVIAVPVELLSAMGELLARLGRRLDDGTRESA